MSFAWPLQSDSKTIGPLLASLATVAADSHLQPMPASPDGQKLTIDYWWTTRLLPVVQSYFS